MTPQGPAGWKPIITAFGIWFAHFMLSWAAGEIWPGQTIANHLAWGFTGIALVAIALHFAKLRRSAGRGELDIFKRRFGYGAIAIATAGVVFNAMPALILLP